MKSILVPCDFSDPAVQAYEFACNIATRTKGKVFVIHAVDLPMMYETTFGIPPYAFDPSLLDSLEDRAKENFKQLQKSTGVKAPETHFESINGTVSSTILDAIKDNQIDLVVMGTHGASGFKEYVFGSNTEKIVRLSHVPVMAIRTAPELRSIKNIVLPSSLAPGQIKFIEKVKELQAFFGAKLHVLLVNTPTRFNLDVEAKGQLEDFAKHYKLENFTLNARNDLFEQEGISRFVEEVKADMVVMATHGRRGLAHLLSGSIAEDIVNHAQCPVWTYNLRGSNS